MIVYEHSESINVFEISTFFFESVTNLIHALALPENIDNCVVHWIVEQTSEVLRVRTNIGRVSVEAFSHLKDSSTVSVFLPEIFGNFRNSVDSNAIEVEFCDNVFYPVLKITTNV
jgi:hypothetical protein